MTNPSAEEPAETTGETGDTSLEPTQDEMEKERLMAKAEQVRGTESLYAAPATGVGAMVVWRESHAQTLAHACLKDSLVS